MKHDDNVITIYGRLLKLNILTGHSLAANWTACLHLWQFTDWKMCQWISGHSYVKERRMNTSHAAGRKQTRIWKGEGHSHTAQTPWDTHKIIQLIYKRYCRLQVKCWLLLTSHHRSLGFIPVQVQLVMHKVAQGQDSLWAFCVFWLSFYKCSIWIELSCWGDTTAPTAGATSSDSLTTSLAKYRVIHKSLRNFRTRLRNNQER